MTFGERCEIARAAGVRHGWRVSEGTDHDGPRTIRWLRVETSGESTRADLPDLFDLAVEAETGLHVHAYGGRPSASIQIHTYEPAPQPGCLP